MNFFFMFGLFFLSNSMLICRSPVQAFELHTRANELTVSHCQVPEPSTPHVPSHGPIVSPVQTPVNAPPVPSPEQIVSPGQGLEPSTSIAPSPGPSQLPGNENPNVCRKDLTSNPIDNCWRHDRKWANNRKQLAHCGVGFGKNAIGGLHGEIYVVTDPSDDPHKPKIGTLRYGTIQDKPLWIIFSKNMLIKLKEYIPIKSFKTIDGRGVEVTIASSKGTCLDMNNVNNVIIHNINIHNCHEDGMTITNSQHIWVDHCSLSRCGDGLIDVIEGSSFVTISNNYLTHHRKAILLGRSDKDVQDKNMRATLAYNHFGEGLIERLPRCRFGYFHVVNNHYTYWKIYAIGGSASPTILSQGNRFLDIDGQSSKFVTKHIHAKEEEWKKWNWRSEGDMLLNGTIFESSGSTTKTAYSKATSLRALPSSLVPLLTRDAGVLLCQQGKCC